MTKATITKLPDPSGFSPDPLTEVLRSGARRLIEQAVEAELVTLLVAMRASATRMVGRGLSGTVICPSAR